MQIEDNLTLLTSILDNGSSIIIPSDGVWGIACKASDQQAVMNISMQSENESTLRELLVSDLPMLKNYASELHPRVETLLSYHERPLRVMCPQKLINADNVYLRIVKDTVSRILLSELNYPLFFVSFLASDLVTSLPKEQLKVANYKHVKFIADRQVEDEEQSIPLLRIKFDDEGMIKVLT